MRAIVPNHQIMKKPANFSPTNSTSAPDSTKKSPAKEESAGCPFAHLMGGVMHQPASGRDDALTTPQGLPISDDQNQLKIGAAGPALLEDLNFREKMFKFDHERIPERVVHARGYGARGYFECTDDCSDITMASVLGETGKKTEAFVRFSTVAGSAGSPDLARDVRGFAVKLYSENGNWDIVGNNIPVFFIQNAMKFPDLVHSAKPEPDSGFPQAQTAHDNFWDFVSLMPESMHMLMWTMSDRAIPRSFRTMEGFGVHTFRMINSEGVSKFVKFLWKPKAGLQSVVWNEAVKINGADPDFHRRDLRAAIDNGDFPEWELGLQVFDEDFAEKFPFSILDATKLIPEELIPLRIVGRLVLDQNVDNFFAETEQVAFCTQNIIQGIDFTNDPLLQGRNFSYLDTQVKRLGGPNFTHIPVNAPRCPVRHFMQDGHGTTKNPTGRANYEPNSWSGSARGPREWSEGFKSFPAYEEGEKVRARAETFADHYSQANQFYRSQTECEQDHMADAFVFELSKVETPEIRMRMVSHLQNISDRLAQAVADGLGIEKLPDAAPPARKPITDLPTSDALSIIKNCPDSFKGRKMGVLLSDGADAKILGALEKALKKEGSMLEIITPKIAGVTLSDGSRRDGDQKIGGGPSVLYDAVVVLAAEKELKALKAMPPVRDFIADAYAHKKFIGFNDATEPLISACTMEEDIDSDAGIVRLGTVKDAGQFIETCRALRNWARP